MITDVFFRRYNMVLCYHNEYLGLKLTRLFMQVAQIVFEDLVLALSLDQDFFKLIHNRLAREIGSGSLYAAREYDKICGMFLVEPYDLWKHDIDTYFKYRVSLIELIFRQIEEILSQDYEQEQSLPHKQDCRFFGFRAQRLEVNHNTRQQRRAAFTNSVNELNIRLSQSGSGLHYHNGFIQFSVDELTTSQVCEPFWRLVSDKKWQNVDLDMKEAVDRRDNNERDAAFYAAKALESTIKIISDEKGWSTGRETGASAYIDNLQSAKNGRFIERWEADVLKIIFSHIRNPHGHGSGSQPAPSLTIQQINWTIESCMSWCKSLITCL